MGQVSPEQSAAQRAGSFQMLIWTNFQSVAFQARVEGSLVDFCASAEGRLHSTFGVNTRRS